MIHSCTHSMQTESFTAHTRALGLGPHVSVDHIFHTLSLTHTHSPTPPLSLSSQGRRGKEDEGERKGKEEEGGKDLRPQTTLRLSLLLGEQASRKAQACPLSKSMRVSLCALVMVDVESDTL